MEGFMLRGWDLIFPGWHWIYELQVDVFELITMVQLGFPHRAGRCRRGVSPVLSPILQGLYVHEW